jgi:uncharacterized protein YdaT
MKNLTPEVRKKAIEIANALYEKENYEEGRIIAIATDTAEEWAKKRGKKIKEDRAPGGAWD